jgi:hypothetical protein
MSSRAALARWLAGAAWVRRPVGCRVAPQPASATAASMNAAIARVMRACGAALLLRGDRMTLGVCRARPAMSSASAPPCRS